jgi:phosphate-selective porin OprO/OprP
MYIKYNSEEYGTFGVGSIAEPTGLDMGTSSKYIPFVERAMLTSMQNHKWGAGLHYENFNLFKERVSLQMAITNNGLNTEAFKDKHLENGQNYVFRLSATPLQLDAGIVHLGFNFAKRPAKESLKFRPENHMGSKYEFLYPGATGRQETGFEFAATYQQFSVQGEYKIQDVANDLKKDYKMTGYYVFGSYFITGEHRPYKKAVFGRVKPKKDIENGGYGAVEVLARYSTMKPSSDLLDVNPGLSKQINNLTFGVNWYLTPHLRLMYNYVLTDDNNDVLGNLKGHLIRAQIDF